MFFLYFITCTLRGSVNTDREKEEKSAAMHDSRMIRRVTDLQRGFNLRENLA